MPAINRASRKFTPKSSIAAAEPKMSVASIDNVASRVGIRHRLQLNGICIRRPTQKRLASSASWLRTSSRPPSSASLGSTRRRPG